METRRITEIGEIKKIYDSRMKRDFARDELRPWASLRGSIRRGEYAGFGLFEGAALLGYAFFVRLPAEEGCHYLFDYLAIAEEHRDEGLGSVFLAQLKEQLGDAACVLGEVEDPDFAPDEAARTLRERRIRFYLRNGCRMTALRSRVFGVDYCLMELPGTRSLSEEAQKTVYAALYRSILPPVFFKTQFRIK